MHAVQANLPCQEGSWGADACNAVQVEMYADPGARGGILEPEGIVEIKFRRPDLVAAMHRLDPVLQQLTVTLPSRASALDGIVRPAPPPCVAAGPPGRLRGAVCGTVGALLQAARMHSVRAAARDVPLRSRPAHAARI